MLNNKDSYTHPGSRRIMGFAVLLVTLFVVVYATVEPEKERTVVLETVWVPGLLYAAWVILNEMLRPTGTVLPWARKFFTSEKGDTDPPTK